MSRRERNATHLRRTLSFVGFFFSVVPVASASDSYVGQAAKKTKEIMDKAIGKVLFIDEAYGLNPRHGGGGASFMQEVSTRVVRQTNNLEGWPSLTGSAMSTLNILTTLSNGLDRRWTS